MKIIRSILASLVCCLVIACTSIQSNAANPVSQPHRKSAVTPVKIMAVGDSITQGQSFGGYRLFLTDYLSRIKGRNVDFVGSLATGDFADNQHEGHPGERIDQLWTDVVPNLTTYNPQIIIVQLGTNDVIQNLLLDTAGARLAALVRDMCVVLPGVKIFVQAPPYITGPTRNQNRINFVGQANAELQKLPTTCSWQLINQVLVGTDLTTDGVHPTYDGYHKMAANMSPYIDSAVVALS